MISLTLMFKGKTLEVFQPASDMIKIGRANDCDIPINNLALSAVHAIISIEGEKITIEDKSDSDHETGVLVNNKKVDSVELSDNDLIQLGKYEIKYKVLAEQTEPVKPEQPDQPDQPAEIAESTDSIFPDTKPLEQGWLQFMNGPKLGRTVKIANSMIRLGKTGKSSAMISARDGQYYISHLEGEPKTKVCNRDLESSRLLLKNGDTLQVGETKMLFFVEDK